MISRRLNKCLYISLFIFVFLFVLGGCMSARIRPMYALNRYFIQSNNIYREPLLGNQWLAILVNNQGKEKIELINLKNRKRVLLPGINRRDSQPISVSVNANGERLAFIHKRLDKTELFLYKRNSGTLQRLEITPKGVPSRVSMDGSGKVLAVQVSRNGRWFVDVIRLK